MKYHFCCLVLAFSFFSSKLDAAKFKGFNPTSSAETVRFSEPVDRFIETDSEFLILFRRHPSFYSFPKTKKNAIEFRDFLKARVKNRKEISVTFNPRTLRINLLEDIK